MPARSTNRFRSASAKLVFALLMLAMRLVALAVPLDAPPERAEALVTVEINGQREIDAVLVLLEAQTSVLVGEKALARWRLRPGGAGTIEHDGERYVALAAIDGLRYRFDPMRLTLAIDAEPAKFERTELASDARSRPKIATPPPGAFLNYDLSLTRAEDETNVRAGLFELGAFGSAGVLTSTAVGRDAPDGRHLTRLDSTFTHDWPDSLRTARVGDLVSRPGTWGRPMRLGGLQYGTNFATQPGFIHTPMLAAVGQARLPSVVDVFVNNTFFTRRDVPPGPFSIGNIPPISGTGAINLVVTDLLGRQQVISQPFYASAALLGPGVTDFSLEAGFVRREYGLSSNRYGEFATAATNRHGWSRTLTSELHAETAPSARTAGGGIDMLFERTALVVSVHGAASDSEAGRGTLGIFGVEHQGRVFRAGARAQWGSNGYRQPGSAPGEAPVARRLTLSAGMSLAPYGSVSVTALRQNERNAAERNIQSATYTHQLGRKSFASLMLTRTSGTAASTGVFLLFSMSFEDRNTLTAAASDMRRSGADRTAESSITLQRALSPGEGWGYRVRATDERELQASVQHQHRFGVLSVDASSRNGDTATRLGAQGSIGLVGAQPFASRPLYDSFALVQVPDFPGTRVRHDNQLEGRINASGVAVLPRLRSFDTNRISLDAVDLPLDARVDALRIVVTPPYRSGVLVPFPVRRERAATVSIMLADGAPIPPGATVRLNDLAETFPVAYHGEAFLSGLAERNEIRVTWKGATCTIVLPKPAANEPIAELGEVLCTGIAR